MKKETIILIGSLLATILIVFLLIIPAFETLSETISELDKQKNNLIVSQNNIKKVDELKKIYPDIKKSEGDFEIALPTETDINESKTKLYDLMNKLVPSSGLNLEGSVAVREGQVVNLVPNTVVGTDDILPKLKTQGNLLINPNILPAAPQESYRVISVSLSLKGTVDNFKKFLQIIENTRDHRIMDVTFFSFTNPPIQEAGTQIIPFSVNLNTYKQPVKASK